MPHSPEFFRAPGQRSRKATAESCESQSFETPQMEPQVLDMQPLHQAVQDEVGLSELTAPDLQHWRAKSTKAG